MPKTIYLVDASTFIHRSYHAIRGLSTKDGRPTNAVYGFVASLNKLLKEKSPEYIAVVFDAKGPSFRQEIYPEYKANRPAMPEDLIVQQEPIRRIVEALGLSLVEIPGLEADDIVASLTAQCLEAGFEVVIVSNDKDYYQLLGEHVSMYDPNPKGVTEMNVETLQEKLEVTPQGFLEAQGLMGDATDNIPGVAGVGEKTAVKLIKEFGNLETLYENLEKVGQAKLKEKLEASRKEAFLSRQLAKLKTDADLGLGPEDLAAKPRDAQTLKEIYRDLEFSRFMPDLEPTRAISYEDYHLVTTSEELEDLVEEIKDAERLSVDLETTSIDPTRAEIVGMSLAARPHRAFYLPVAHQTLAAVQLDREKTIAKLKPLLEYIKIRKIGQNIKYDYIVLKKYEVTLGPISDDAMVASYLLDPGSGGHNLERIAKTYLGHDCITYEEVVGNKKTGFDQISPEAARDYACEDADVALILSERLRSELEKAELLELYETLELPLIEVLAEMEMNGVLLDADLLNDLARELGWKMEETEARIHRMAGRRFNINSPKQLGQVLFEDLKLPQGKKTRKKSGYSTDMEVLTELAVQHELPAEVLNYRTLAKLRTTYAEALVQLINPATGRVHTSFNQAVAATGRLSSSDPNLQNIPIRTEEGRRIRAAFIAQPGWKILSADYSQIELRILAHCSQDQVLMDAFRHGQDIHTRTAAEVFGVLPSMVTGEMRRGAKAINFGIIYGQQAFGLARQLGIEKKEAREYINQYFKRYAGVRTYIDQTIEQARKSGFVTTLFGRKRTLPDLNSKNYQARSMAERMAVNTPFQGTAADLIKKAMLLVHQAMKKAGYKAKMILQVHDELVFEAPEDEIEPLGELVKREMEGVMKLDVPLVVDVSVGANWAAAH